ncbi:integrase [Streptomyces lavendofoliae]|uniref:integrase n=1 Tax=Streptomyces lavendofoliae TaxID=67314 RepID=UPI003D94BD40
MNDRLPADAAPGPLLPAAFDPDLRARLATLDEASDAQDQRPANTRRSYASDWKTWEAFCAQLQVPVTAATRGTLRAFVDYLWNREKRAYSTIDRKLAGVVVTLRRPPYRVIVDPDATAAARELLKDYRKKAEEAEEPERGRGRAPAMRLDDLRLIVSKCDTDIFGLRDRAMLLIGFAIAARRAELVGLRLRHITEDPDGKGLLVSVRVSKTEPCSVPVLYGSSAATCPVRAWNAWRTAAGITDPDRHAFRRIHHTGAVQPQGHGGTPPWQGPKDHRRHHRARQRLEGPRRLHAERRPVGRGGQRLDRNWPVSKRAFHSQRLPKACSLPSSPGVAAVITC